MSPLKIPVPIPGAPPHGVRTAKPPGSHPVPLRSKYAQDGDGYPPASTDGVRGFMDNLEAMAAEYRRGLFGGEPQVATMSKSEAASTLRSRYEVLHAENRAAQLEGLASAAVVMPKPPPKAPPGIAPPKPPGGGLSSPPVSTARLAGAAVSVDDSRATPPTPPRPPPGISPPTSQPPSRPVSANPFPGSPSSPQPGTPGKAPKAILPPRPRAAVGDASHDIPSLPPTAMQLPAPQAWLATQAAQASKLPDIPNPAPPKIAPPPGVLPSSSSVPNSHSPSRRESVTGSGSVPISHLFRRTGAQGPLAPPKLAGSPRAVLAPPPPPGLSAAIWVTHGPGGQRPPPPPGQPLNLAPAVGPPNRGRRAGSVPPIPREQLGEDELIALRMRALEGLENPGRQRNTGKRNGRSKGGKNK